MVNRIPDKYAQYVVTDLPKYIEVAGHHRAACFWITQEMFPGVNIEVAGVDASKMVRAPHADAHVHDSPEIYMFPSNNRGDVVLKVRMGDEEFQVESPCSIFIPAGVVHCFTVLKCDSPNWVFGFLLPDYGKH